MGDNENNPGGQGGEPVPPTEAAADPPEAKAAPSLGDRKNAAKAFYRALYSGEDVVPEEFGIGTKTVEKQSSGPCPSCARLEAEAKESEKKATDNENYYKRIAADFENYRKRNDREREEAVGLGIQKAIESILPALDDLDRAKQSLATVTDTKAVVDSLNLVFARFSKCLDPLGVKPMEVLGEHFDPKFHEPVQEVKTTYFADGAVAQELRRGYMLRDKVIRPALVNVASNESGVITPMPSSIESATPAATEAVAAVVEKESEKEEVKSSEAAEVSTSDSAGSESAKAESAPEEKNEKNEKNGEEKQKSAETEKAEIDQAASKQRAANALERLRKPNPKATAELPAFKPDELERVTEPPQTAAERENSAEGESSKADTGSSGDTDSGNSSESSNSSESGDASDSTDSKDSSNSD